MLKVWIPFVNSSYKNQGLANVQTSILGTVTYEDGKLGKAARFGDGTSTTQANGISINSNLVEELGNEYSCAVWVKPMGNHLHYEGAIISSGDWNHDTWAFGVNQNNTKVDLFGPRYNRYIDCNIPVNEWTHLVSTFKNSIGTLYKNGVLVGTYDFSNLPYGFISDANNTTIGRETYANGYFSFNGCLQDIRVYNHCLSTLEIHKLSQGLIGYYPLNREGFGADNLVIDSKNLDQSHLKSGNEYIAINVGQSYMNIPDGTEITISFDLEIKYVSAYSNNAYIFSVYNTNNKGPKQIVVGNIGRQVFENETVGTTIKKRINATGTIIDRASSEVTLNYNTIEFYSNYNTGNVFAISNLKVELGNKATPWIPNPADSLYSALGLNSGIVYDVSGYQYNGTRKLGTYAYSSNTPKYNVCIEFDGNTSIQTTANTQCIGTGDFTISAWINIAESTKTYQPIVSNKTTGAASVGFAMYYNHTQNKFLWSTADGSAATEIWTKNTFTNIYDQWIHIVMVRNSSDAKIGYFYINGQREELNNVPGIRNISTDHGLVIGGLYSDAANYRWTGKISDVRIYATALSEDDILQLYNASISL